MLGYGTSNDGAFERVFYGEKAKTESGAPEGELSQSQLAQVKALLWEESQHPRDEKGRFTGGAGNSGVTISDLMSTASVAGMAGVTRHSEEDGSEMSRGAGSFDKNPPTFRGDVRDKGRGIVSPAAKHLVNLLLTNKELTSKNKEAYSRTLSYVVGNIPPHLHTRIVENIHSVHGFNNLADLRFTSPMLYGLHEKGVAGYHPRNRVLIIDGEERKRRDKRINRRENIYAHEITHALDWRLRDPDDPQSVSRISSSREWEMAHYEELFGGELSRYAKNKEPIEGFAEVGNFIYSSPDPEEAAKRLRIRAPKCYAIWEKEGLLTGLVP
jgi:hypothetical protein